MSKLDEEKQAKLESQLAGGMETPVSEAQVNDIINKEPLIRALFKKLGNRVEDVKLLWNMLLDYKNGKYKELPWKLVAAIVFFFVYLLNPFDLVPDVFPILGYVDDLSVLSLVLAAFTSDIDAYKKWLANNGDSVTQIG